MAEQNWKDQKSSFFAASLAPLLWTLVFFIVPMGIVWAYSFGHNAGLTEIEISGTFSNYARAIEPLYLKIFVKSAFCFSATTRYIARKIGAGALMGCETVTPSSGMPSLTACTLGSQMPFMKVP